jgi:type I restriction enzyme, S subunit
MTEGGDFDKLGRGALWEQNIPDCIHQNHVFRVRPERTRLLPSFFVHFLQTQAAKGYFLQCAKKTTNLASINMRQLRALPLPLPPIVDQERFERELKSIRHINDLHSRRVSESNNLFDSLVQRAFRGKL